MKTFEYLSLLLLAGFFLGMMQLCAPAIPQDQGTADRLSQQAGKLAVMEINGEWEIVKVKK
jgi:hypothetical protein